MKLRTKLSFLIAGLVAAIMLLTGVLLMVFEKNYIIEQRQANKIVVIKAFANVCGESVFNDDILSLVNYVKNLKNSMDTISYAMFVDNDNRILAHSDPSMLRGFARDPISVNSQKSKELLMQSYRLSPEDNSSEIIDMSLPVYNGERKVGVARIGFCKKTIDRQVSEALNKTRERVVFVDLPGPSPAR